MSRNEKIAFLVCAIWVLGLGLGYREGKRTADRYWQKYANNLEMAIPCSTGGGCSISPEGVVKHIELQNAPPTNEYEKFVVSLENQQKPRMIPAASDAFGTQKFVITLPIRNVCKWHPTFKNDMVCHVESDSRLDALVSLGATVWTQSEWEEAEKDTKWVREVPR